MAYFLVALGLLLGYLDYLGTANVTGAARLVWQENTQGSPPFYKWLGALILLGLLGYIPNLRGVATGMLILVLLAILLKHTSAVNTLVSKV